MRPRVFTQPTIESIHHGPPREFTTQSRHHPWCRRRRRRRCLRREILTRPQGHRFADVSPLHIEDLLENGNSLRGNEYVVQGVIDEKLQWTPDRGQLVSVRVDTPSGDEFIGIEIPAEFNSLNIDTRQKYAFKVKFRQGGIAVATGVNRL